MGRATVDGIDFFDELTEICSEVFSSHPELEDHRLRFPWLTGSLGDPAATVWFVAENPSLTQVRKLPTDATPEAQWSVSPGDRLFREALVRHGFKSDHAMTPGGWSCYITNVIKSAAVVKEWRNAPAKLQREIAEFWSPALRHELKHGNPGILVVLGDKADKLLTHLERTRLVPRLPPRRVVYHYSYLGSRPESGGLRRPQRDPGRIAEWNAEFAAVAEQYRRQEAP